MKLFPAFAVGAALLLAGVIRAADPDKPPTEKELTEAEGRASVVADLATAAELTAFGRGQACEATGPKVFKSPESLVLAGGILWRAHSVVGGKVAELDVVPTDEAGKPLAVKREKTKSLKEQATELFDEARAMAAEGGDKGRTAAVEAMIKREEASEPSRGAVGGPKRATVAIAPGATHHYKVAFIGGLPAAVAMQSTGSSKLQIVITHVGGNKLFGLKGVTAAYNWVPARDRDGGKWYNITVTNVGKAPTAYVIATN